MSLKVFHFWAENIFLNFFQSKNRKVGNTESDQKIKICNTQKQCLRFNFFTSENSSCKKCLGLRKNWNRKVFISNFLSNHFHIFWKQLLYFHHVKIALKMKFFVPFDNCKIFNEKECQYWIKVHTFGLVHYFIHST